MVVEFKASNCSFIYPSPPTEGIQSCMCNYLKGLQDYLSNNSEQREGLVDCTFNLVFHSAYNLYLDIRWQASQNELKMDKQKTLCIPIIHLTIFDLFSNEKVTEFLVPKRFKKIIDSSIWNYYVPLEVFKENDQGNPIWVYSDNYSLFIKALKEIALNEGLHLYDLIICREYADLHARILEQSFLEGSHKVVSPFLFHSENEMKEKLRKIVFEKKKDEKQNVLEDLKKYKWRFLLLDDKSVNRITGVNDQKVDICKLQIIYNNLHRILGFSKNKIWCRILNFEQVRDGNNECRIIDKKNHLIIENDKNCDKVKIDNGRVENGCFDSKSGKFQPANNNTLTCEKDIQIIIDCVKHVDAAEYCIQKYRYDIVLIDYLLDKDKIKDEHKQEYGYYLLKNLYQVYRENQNEEIKDKIKIGLKNHLAIMFISAFTTAVHERLLEMGFGRFERGLWFIGDSACPTNTPYLFSYLLLKLMSQRIKGLKNGSEGQLFTIIDLLEKIYVKAGNSGIESVRKEANYHFNHLLFMRAKYKKLMNVLDEKEEKDLKEHYNESQYIANYLMNMKSSLLVYSAFKVVHHFSEAFFDHLQHLVYLTAFGTIRQWQDMWEEYVFVYKELYDYDNYAVDNEGKKQDRGKKICNAIKEYIINLKENSI